MLRPRLHLDIGWSDLASVFTPLRDDTALTKRIEALWPAHARVALSVRTAFDALLTTLGLPDGAPVAMSAVNIANMADIARAHGLRVAPVDIELATLSPTPAELDRVLVSTRAKLYVHAHLYGARNDVAALAAVCAKRGARLVEDCAQGYDGVPPTDASVADVSLYSFGPIKAATCLGGAIAVFREQKLADNVGMVLGMHPAKQERWFRARGAKIAALKLISAPALYGATVAALGRNADATLGAAARGFSGDLMRAIRHRCPRAMLRLMAERMANPPSRDWRAHAGAILDARIAGRLPRPGAQAGANAFWLYPILVDDPDTAAAHMRRAGFDATRGATSLRVIGEGASNAEALMRHVLYLPIAPTMSERELVRLADAACAIGTWAAPGGTRLAA